MGFMELPPPLAGGPTTGSTMVTSCSDVAMAGRARQKIAKVNKARIGSVVPKGTERGCLTRSCPNCGMSVRNSKGIRVVKRAAAETAALLFNLGNMSLNCAQVKRSAVRQVESWIFIGSFWVEWLVLTYPVSYT